MLKKVKKITFFLAIILLFISAVLVVSSRYISENFGKGIVNQIIYYMFTNFNKGSNAVIFEGIRKSYLFVLFIYFILIIPITDFFKTRNTLEIYIFKVKVKLDIYPVKIVRRHYLLYSIIIFFLAGTYSYYTSGISNYLRSLSEKTRLYENYYVDPSKVKLTFPKYKQNLVIIFLESMENSMLSKDNGGIFQESVIPGLERIAKDNINFSNSNKIGGALEDWGSACTVCGMVAQTAGIPAPNNIVNIGFSQNKPTYLPGAFTLGDILKKEDYNLEIMFGSDASFGDRDKYFKTHGNYFIYDYNKAKEKNKIAKDYNVFWGFEDNKLFEYAKEEITNLAAKSKPFNLILLTVDTHDSGYLDTSCKNNKDYSLKNIISCSSDKTSDFIDWMSMQDFYKNTTIVIVGDHLIRQTNLFPNTDFNNYTRTIFNTIINANTESTNYNNRVFSSYDMYPTILSSIGVKIEGEKLGLGTNLFSNENTIIEKIGYDKFKQEIVKSSDYFNNIITH